MNARVAIRQRAGVRMHVVPPVQRVQVARTREVQSKTGSRVRNYGLLCCYALSATVIMLLYMVVPLMMLLNTFIHDLLVQISAALLVLSVAEFPVIRILAKTTLQPGTPALEMSRFQQLLQGWKKPALASERPHLKLSMFATKRSDTARPLAPQFRLPIKVQVQQQEDQVMSPRFSLPTRRVS